MLINVGLMIMTSCARKLTRHLRSSTIMSRLRTLMLLHYKTVALQNSNLMAREKRRRPRLTSKPGRISYTPSVPGFHTYTPSSILSAVTKQMVYILFIAYSVFGSWADTVLGPGLQGRAKITFNIPNDFRSCIIEGASYRTGISYRWMRAQAHLAVMKEKELSCCHCMIDVPGRY